MRAWQYDSCSFACEQADGERTNKESKGHVQQGKTTTEEKKKKTPPKKQLICFPLDEKVADESQQDLASVHSFEDSSMVGDSLSNKTGEQTYFLEPCVVEKKKENKKNKKRVAR